MRYSKLPNKLTGCLLVNNNVKMICKYNFVEDFKFKAKFIFANHFFASYYVFLHTYLLNVNKQAVKYEI